MPPAKRRRGIDKRVDLHKRLGHIRAEVAKLKRDRAIVKRAEFAEMTRSLRQVQRNTDELVTQFTRIAQIQAEVDVIKRALIKAKLLD